MTDTILSAIARKQIEEALTAARETIGRAISVYDVESADKARADIRAALALLASLPAVESLVAERIAPEGQALEEWVAQAEILATRIGRGRALTGHLAYRRAGAPEAGDYWLGIAREKLDAIWAEFREHLRKRIAAPAPTGKLSEQQVRALMNVAREWAGPDPYDCRSDKLEMELRRIRVAQEAPAHSKSEYKRRVAQGDPSVLPPEDRADALLLQAAEHGHEACAALATVHYNHMGETFADVDRCFDAAKALYADVAAIRTYLEGK